MVTFRQVCFGALAFCAIGSVHADFIVDTIADEDTNNASCSLREAIIAVNTQADYNGCTSATAGEQHVAFALPSETITLGSVLPQITRQIFIDGTTQGPAACTPVPPTVHVHIVGMGNASDTTGNGLEFVAGSDGSIVKGLALTDFGTTDGLGNARAGILIEAPNVTVGCDVLQNNTYGVNVQPSGTGAIIGVANANEWLPNLISGNLYNDVYLLGADNVVVSGNYIGVDATGLVALDSGGIYDGGGNKVRIGVHVRDGSSIRQRNVIGVHAPPGHAASCVNLAGTNAVVAGNYIGVGADGHTALPVGVGGGVDVGGSGNLIGCDGPGSWDDCRNVIAEAGSGSTTTAVRVSGTNNAIVNNFIGTAADGTTTLGGNDYTVGVQLYYGNALVARNVINVGNQGYGIALTGNPNAPVFLNQSDGVFANSRLNCIEGNYYGLAVLASPTLPNIFTSNWWGAPDGPSAPQVNPPINGSGQYILGDLSVAPFLTARPVNCTIDRIFGDGFYGQ